MTQEEPYAESTREQFNHELEKATAQSVLSPEYRRKKIILWLIRTLIAIALYYFFWEHKWVRWSLILYVPLNLFGILSIFGWNYFLKKKIAKTYKTIEQEELEIKKATEVSREGNEA